MVASQGDPPEALPPPAESTTRTRRFLAVALALATAVTVLVAQEFPRAVFFAGKLVFEHERWYQRLLHNETAYALQRRLQFAGLNAMALPFRVIAGRPA